MTLARSDLKIKLMTILADYVFFFLLAVIFIWLASLSFFVLRMLVHYQGLTRGVSKMDLKSALDKLLEEAEGNRIKISDLEKIQEEIKKENLYNLQRVGLVRFNPFADTGGNQSFSLALLDGEGSGLVISSLHSRDATRIYAKPVKKEKAAGYHFSAEEEKAIRAARRIK